MEYKAPQQFRMLVCEFKDRSAVAPKQDLDNLMSAMGAGVRGCGGDDGKARKDGWKREGNDAKSVFVVYGGRGRSVVRCARVA